MVYGIGCNNGYCVNNLSSLDNVKGSKVENKVNVSNIVLNRPMNNMSMENYGKSLLLLNRFAKDIKPSSLILDPKANIDSIDGERVYTSEGKLVAIIDEKQDSKTIYEVSDDDKNEILNVIVKDNKSGKILKEQNNDSDGKIIFVKEYADNNISKTTFFENGKLDSVILNKEGYNSHSYIGNNFYNNSVRFHEEINTPYGFKSEHINMKNGFEKVDIAQETTINNNIYSNDLTFNNGALVSVEQNNKTIVTNYVGLDKIANKDLVQYEKFNLKNLNDSIKNIEGERTHYSNGQLESIKGKLDNKFTVANFDINGNLKKVSFENITLELLDNGKSQKIIENLENGKTRTTLYYNNGTKEVSLKENNVEKCMSIYTDGTMGYHESTKLEDGKVSEKTMFFNKQGLLEDSFEFID